MAQTKKGRTSSIASGKEMASSDLRQIFAQQMMEDYFPVPLHRMGATFHFDASADNLVLGDDVVLIRRQIVAIGGQMIVGVLQGTFDLYLL